MIKETLKKLKDIHGYPCITILLNTHRTSPENLQDAINLKNLIKEVEQRLSEESSSREMAPYMEKLQDLSGAIDHYHNLDGLAIFVNQDIAEYVRLPISVEPRTVIDHTFATRDLVRAINREGSYFIMTLNQQETHLYEALGPQILREIRGEFPFENGPAALSKEKAAQGLDDNLLREYFNKVDKAFQEVHKTNPGEVVLVGTERNIGYFYEVTDDDRCIITTWPANFENGKTKKLGEEVWERVQNVTEERRARALEELSQATGQKTLASSLDEIWELVQQGRGDLLVVEEGYFQPVKMEDNRIELVENATEPGIVDDIIDEIVEHQLRYKGRVVFMPDGSLEAYDRIALKMRY